MQAICQLGESGETRLSREWSGCWRQAGGAGSSELLGVVKVVMVILPKAGRLPSHLPTLFSYRGENELQASATSRRMGSLLDVHWDEEPQGCRGALGFFQRKEESMRTPPGTPVHCIQLWSCQIDVVSEAILQGSWAPRWKQLMVFLLISSTSPHKKAKYLH